MSNYFMAPSLIEPEGLKVSVQSLDGSAEGISKHLSERREAKAKRALLAELGLPARLLPYISLAELEAAAHRITTLRAQHIPFTVTEKGLRIKTKKATAR